MAVGYADGVWRIKLAFATAGVLGVVPLFAGWASLPTMLSVILLAAILWAPRSLIDRFGGRKIRLLLGAVGLLGPVAFFVGASWAVAPPEQSSFEAITSSDDPFNLNPVLEALLLITGALTIWGPFLVYAAALKTRVGAVATGIALLGMAIWTYVYVGGRFAVGSSTAPLAILNLPLLGWPTVALAILFERMWLWGERQDRRPIRAARVGTAPGRTVPPKRRRKWRVVVTGNHVGLAKKPPSAEGEQEPRGRSTPEEI